MLTDSGIKALKPKDKLYKVTDRDGMYVAVNPSGAVVFRYDYRLNGRRETLTLGRYGAPRPFTFAHIARRSSGLISVSSRFRKVGRMSRS